MDLGRSSMFCQVHNLVHHIQIIWQTFVFASDAYTSWFTCWGYDKISPTGKISPSYTAVWISLFGCVPTSCDDWTFPSGHSAVFDKHFIVNSSSSASLAYDKISPIGKISPRYGAVWISLLVDFEGKFPYQLPVMIEHFHLAIALFLINISNNFTQSVILSFFIFC